MRAYFKYTNLMYYHQIVFSMLRKQWETFIRAFCNVLTISNYEVSWLPEMFQMWFQMWNNYLSKDDFVITDFMPPKNYRICYSLRKYDFVGIAKVISKSDEHKARGRFEITSRITPWIVRHEVQLLINRIYNKCQSEKCLLRTNIWKLWERLWRKPWKRTQLTWKSRGFSIAKS